MTIPVPVSSFVGRAGDVRLVVSWLGADRLVTLTGVGGVGKTRLAVEVAHEAEPGFDRVAMVELDELTHPGVLASQTATALGLPDPTPDDPFGGLVRLLGEQRTLLVVDNCEHLVDAVAAMVARLVTETATTTVLATSRRPLGVDGERIHIVHPLAIAPQAADTVEVVAAAPAVELFVDRARQVDDSFRVSADEASRVAEICRAVDGMPLAIELAAAQLAGLSVLELSGVIRSNPGLLQNLRRDIRPRQQTLTATIDWSLQLLAPEEAVLLNRLSVFVGGFAVADAVAVCSEGLSTDCRLLLVSLVEQSLVVHDRERDRYRLLESIRAHLRRGLDEAEQAELSARHARWFTTLAEDLAPRLREADISDALATYRAQGANLRAALDWLCAASEGELGSRLVAAMAYWWSQDGRLHEGSGWLRWALAEATPSAGTRVDLLVALAYVEGKLGNLHDGRRLCVDGEQQARQLGESRRVADALLWLGVDDWALGALESAARAQDEAYELYHEVDHPWGMAFALAGRGRTAIAMGDADAAGWFDRAVQVARGSAPVLVAVCEEQLARIALADGELVAAQRLASDSLAGHESLGYAEGVATARNLLGLVATGLDHRHKAREHHLAALHGGLEIGHLGVQVESVLGLAALALRLGFAERSARLVGAAKALADDRAGSSPIAQAQLRDLEAQVRGALSPAAVAAALAKGATLSSRLIFAELSEAGGFAVGPAAPVSGQVKLVEPLTERELAVLRLLPSELTQREMSDELYVSLNTIKSHVKAVFRKLSVSNRQQAVERARQLELL